MFMTSSLRGKRMMPPADRIYDPGQGAKSATVVNSSLVEDPTVRLPGFDLHRCQWSVVTAKSF